MKKYLMQLIRVCMTIFIIFSLAFNAYAHSGRTDSRGGHKDNKNKSGLGSYHYHCGGYPAHLHPTGYCPYRDVFPKSVSIKLEKTTLRKGESISFSAAVSPSNACNTSVDIECDNSDVIKLSQGTITAIGYGTAKITATSFNGKKSTTTITVKEITAQKVSINNKPELLYIGDSYSLTSTITPDNVDNPAITWSTSDTEIATISSSGQVQAKKAGTVTIKATASNGVAGTFKLNIKEKVVESIDIAEEDTVIHLNESIDLHATIIPADATYKTITWSSEDDSVAVVTADGRVQAQACGTTVITATSANGLTDKIQVTVDEVIANKIVIEGPDKLKIGQADSLQVAFYPENTSVKDIIWESSDKDILLVDDTGAIRALGLGEVTVTAKQKDTDTSFKLEVLPIPVERVEIIVDLPEKVHAREVYTFTAVVAPDNATFPEVAWSSSDERVATIDEWGVLETHASGEVVIVATTADGVYDTYKLNVKISEQLLRTTIGAVACSTGVSGYVLKKLYRYEKLRDDSWR